MLKKKRLLSCIICLVLIFVGIPFSAEEVSSTALVTKDQPIFQKADPNEISETFSTPTAWKQQLAAKNQALTKSDLTHASIQTVLDQTGITGLSKYQYYQLLSEEDFEDFVPNQLLVSFSAEVSAFESSVLNSLVQSKEEVADLFYTITFKEEYTREGLMTLLEKVIGDVNVVMAQPNFIAEYAQYYSNMDHADSSMHAALEQINAPLAWNYATGKNVKVGMVDTGVTTSAVTVATGNEPGCTVATRNHGSAVATVIAGHGRQYGVAPDAIICCKGGCRFCAQNNSEHPGGTDISAEIIVSSIDTLIDANYRIINLSASVPSSTLSPFIQIITNNPNVLFVQSAGNENVDLDTISSYTYHSKSNYIRVAAVDRYDNRAGNSSYGDQSVHIAAPGEGLIIETPLWGFNDENLLWYGTSFAAPFVSGAAALLLELDSTLTAAEMKNILLNTADVLSPLDQYVQGGRRLNVGAAVLALSPDYSSRVTYIDSGKVLWAKDNVNTSWVTIDTNVKSVALDTCRVYYLKNDNKLYFRDKALTSASIAIDTTGTVTDFAVCGQSLVIRRGTTLSTYTLNESTNTFSFNTSIANVSKYTLSGNMLGYVLSTAPKRLRVDTQIHDTYLDTSYGYTFDGNISNVFSIGPRFHLFYANSGYAVCDMTNYCNMSYDFITELRCYVYSDCTYVVSTGIIRRVYATNDYLTMFNYNSYGNVDIENIDLVAPNNATITACKVVDDRTIFLAGGNLYGIKGFSSTNTTPILLATGVRSVNCVGNMIGIIKNNGEFYTKTGSLTATWTLQASSGVASFALAP